MSDILTITREHVSGILTKDAAPAAFCGDGDTVVFETRDCYDDAVVSEERPLGDKADPIENPVTGPLYVEGAEPGDVLKVEILDIRLRDWGVMRSSTMCGVFHEDFTERTALPEMAGVSVEEVLLAHELYHYMEHIHPQLFTCSYRHRQGRAALFGPARLVSLSEIAAGAFIAGSLGFDYSCYLYDLAFTYSFSPKEAARLFARMPVQREGGV